MSMLNAAASYRREDRAAPRVEQRVPVVMPLVDVRVDVDGHRGGPTRSRAVRHRHPAAP